MQERETRNQHMNYSGSNRTSLLKVGGGVQSKDLYNRVCVHLPVQTFYSMGILIKKDAA
jgi:hypothetical protein